MHEMMGSMMHAMGWSMMLVSLLAAMLLVLGLAALVKYVFFR